MFKRLGTFVVLAVCLFAIVIVMGGCATAKWLPVDPNPFNPGTGTWIAYELLEPAEVTFTIYDSDRKLVRTLELGQKPAGTYKSRDRAAHWDGQNEQGEPVASGVYYCKLTAGKFSPRTQKLLFIGTGLRPSYSVYSQQDESTTWWITYYLSEPADVTLTLHDSNGNLVRTLDLGQRQADAYWVDWDGRNAQGIPVPWGTYFCLFTAGEFSTTQKVEKSFLATVNEILVDTKKEVSAIIEERRKLKLENMMKQALEKAKKQ